MRYTYLVVMTRHFSSPVARQASHLLDTDTWTASGLTMLQLLHFAGTQGAAELTLPGVALHATGQHLVYAALDCAVPIVLESELPARIEVSTITYLGDDALTLFEETYLEGPLDARIVAFPRAPGSWTRNMQRRLDRVLLDAAVRMDARKRT